MRAHVAVVVSAAFPPGVPGLEYFNLAGGRHAVLEHKGPYATLAVAYDWLYGAWLPRSGKEPRDAPLPPGTSLANSRGMSESPAIPSLSQRMEVLAALEPSPFPVISLYLSLSTDQSGREDYQQFVRKVFNERARALPKQSPERESFDKDVTRIQEHLQKKDATAGQAVAITRAQQTAARIRFIEDGSLLADVGGVGALLRFRI